MDFIFLQSFLVDYSTNFVSMMNLTVDSSSSYVYTLAFFPGHNFNTNDYLPHEVASFYARSQRSVQTGMQSSFCSPVRRWDMSFTYSCLICKFSYRILWHVLIDISTTSATFLIVMNQSVPMILFTCAMVSLEYNTSASNLAGIIFKGKVSTFKRISLKCLRLIQARLSES